MTAPPLPKVSRAPAFPLIWVVPILALAIGGWTFPSYIALSTLVLNLIVAAVLTPVFNAIAHTASGAGGMFTVEVIRPEDANTATKIVRAMATGKPSSATSGAKSKTLEIERKTAMLEKEGRTKRCR